MYRIAMVFIFACVGLGFFGCGTIKRSDFMANKKGETNFSVTREPTIFGSLSWSTPPVGSIPLMFTEGAQGAVAKIFFEGKPIELSLNGKQEMGILSASGVSYVPVRKSDGTIYYSLNVLKTKDVAVTRSVFKTRFVTEQVFVAKTVPVQKSRQVANHGPNGSVSYRTEMYTDFETRHSYETRTVPKTEQVWETAWEKRVDIPVYDYYPLGLGEDRLLNVYRIARGQGYDYYLQNPMFYRMESSQNGLFGDIPVAVIMVDTNANGNYFDPDDSVLLNTWNPYEKGSTYAGVAGFMDNFWYSQSYITKEKFVSFSLNPTGKTISVNTANDPYANSKETGSVEIRNLDASKDEVRVNDERVFGIDGKILKRKIEYGYYRLKIGREGRIPFEATILIDAAHQNYVLDYLPGDAAGELNFSSDTLRTWTLLVSPLGGEPRIYVNQKQLYLRSGSYEVEIVSDGIRLKKNIDLLAGDKVTIDFQSEVDKQAAQQKKP